MLTSRVYVGMMFMLDMGFNNVNGWASMNENENVVNVESVVPTSIPVVKTPRKPAKPRARATSFDGVIAAASTVNAKNIDAKITAFNASSTPDKTPARNVGRYTGMRVVAFQNSLFADNVTRQLTDVQLLFVLRVEHPNASGAIVTGSIATGLGIVRDVRAHINRNGHDGPMPSTPLIAYTDAR